MRVLLALALALCLTAATSRAQSIAIYGDPAATDCTASAPPMSGTTFYVIAYLAGPVSGGITSAEFSIDGWPTSGWFFNASASPAANVTLGDPLGPVGCNIAFPGCQTGSPAGLVLLYTVQAFNVGDTTNHDLRVRARVPPTNPQFNCPLVTICDAPFFTRFCVHGGVFYLNSTPGIVTPAHTPQPPDGATGVSTNADLSWIGGRVRSCVLGIPVQSVYFGTAADPPLVAPDYAPTTYDPGPLAPFTTYHWRVTLSLLGSPASSPVWSFTTGTPVAVDATAWSTVKQLFR